MIGKTIASTSSHRPRLTASHHRLVGSLKRPLRDNSRISLAARSTRLRATSHVAMSSPAVAGPQGPIGPSAGPVK